MDFGAGAFLGAATLTQEVLPPGTGAYRSPEARRFQSRFWRKRGAHYKPGPPDDLYALGVTAYRLVTGTYPAVPFVPPEQLVTVCLELARLICQLLLVKPAARGTAAQVAEALELAAQADGPEAERPILPRTSKAPARRRRLPAPPPPARAGRLWLAAAAGFVALLALQGWWALRRGPMRQPPQPLARVERDEDRQDAGTSLAQEVLGSSARIQQPEPRWEGINLEVPKTPLPGQVRSPCKKWQAAEIHGGCWRRPEESTPPCRPGDYEWQGVCYYPVLAPTPPATSGGH
jgi:hypothetical protein